MLNRKFSLNKESRVKYSKQNSVQYYTRIGGDFCVFQPLSKIVLKSQSGSQSSQSPLF